MEKFINGSIIDAETQTSVIIDNSTNFKDFNLQQKSEGGIKDLIISFDTESNTIEINKVVLQGTLKELFFQFINQ